MNLKFDDVECAACLGMGRLCACADLPEARALEFVDDRNARPGRLWALKIPQGQTWRQLCIL